MSSTQKVIYTDNNHCTVTPTSPEYPDGYSLFTANGSEVASVVFQSGPVHENGVNGFTNEHLIAILIERISIKHSHLPCIENVSAMNHLHSALKILEFRSEERRRQVDGTHVK